jgi:hypothetical protein
MAETFTVTVKGGKVPEKTFPATLNPQGDDGFAVQDAINKAVWYVNKYYPITFPAPDPDRR